MMKAKSIPSFFKLKNTIQNYPWGSTTALNHLFGVPNPDNRPQAELWMGAHRNGCSVVEYNGEEVLLNKLIADDPCFYLSDAVAAQFGELPFLFKVLAAGNALSIQVHPSKAEAEQGFALEQQAGVALDSPYRNYRDANHKPELVYALTEYQAMNGFRSFASIMACFTALNIPAIEYLVNDFALNLNGDGLKTFFTHILQLEGESKHIALSALMDTARQQQHQSELYQLIIELEKQYPDDIGLFAPLFLNVITLQPGEAMFLDARTPHAYLKGTGLEVMANSDNVLRAGLTPKNIDVDELVKCTLFAEKPVETLLMTPTGDEEQVYPIPVDDFKFSLIQDPDGVAVAVNSAEIVFTVSGEIELHFANNESVTLSKGESAFIPAYVAHYKVLGSGVLARVYCSLSISPMIVHH